MKNLTKRLSLSRLRAVCHLGTTLMLGSHSTLAGDAPPAFDIGTLRAQIAEAVSSGQKKVVIPPGIYRGRVDGNVFITIKGAKDLEVEAVDVTLICKKLTRAIEITDCDNLRIRGLKVDYDPLPFTQGTIIAVDPADKWVDVKIHDGYPQKAYSRIDVVDTRTRHRKHGMPFLWGTTAELRGNGIVRVMLEKGFERSAAPGDLASMSSGPEPGGIAHAVVIENCKQVSLENFTVHAAPGYGIINGLGHGDHHYNKVHITPGPKPEGATEDRLLSSSWDAIQFNGLHKGPLMENCVVKSAGDDSWSLSSRDFLVLAAEGRKIWLVNRVTYESGVQVGDRLARSLDGLKPRVAAIIRENVPVDRVPMAPELRGKIEKAKTWDYYHFKLERIREIELDVDYPWEPGISVYSPDRNCSGFILRNNLFHSPGRAGLLNGAGDGVIEGNTYIDCDSALSIYPNLPEGAATGSQNIIFRNNTIRGSNNFCAAPWSLVGGAITICHTKPKKQPADAGVFRDITIENNTFQDVRGPVFLITSTSGLRIASNRLIDCQHLPPLSSGRDWGVDSATLGWLKHNTNVKIVDNEIKNRGKYGTSEPFVIIDQPPAK